MPDGMRCTSEASVLELRPLTLRVCGSTLCAHSSLFMLLAQMEKEIIEGVSRVRTYLHQRLVTVISQP